MELNYKIIGLKIKAKRQSLKISQETLAEQTNLNWRSISNIERGICEPKLSTIYKVCKALRLSLDEILVCNNKQKSSNRYLLELELLEALSKTKDNDLESLIKFIENYKK